ncbi:hypothetical protein ND864_19380 [Leptospira levettii]|nr:hypothetical protein [Leptospira levettii]
MNRIEKIMKNMKINSTSGIKIILFTILTLNSLTAQSIDFTKEKPIHPFYETMDENYSIDCKEKQLCMENCNDSFTFISNKNKDKNNIRLSCLAECRKTICVSKKKK